MSADVIRALPERLRDARSVFDRTGGLYAAGLARSDGEVFVVREDVGRHNAIDRVIGFVRGDRANVSSHPERVAVPVAV